MLPGWPLCPGAPHVPAASPARGDPEICLSVPPTGVLDAPLVPTYEAGHCVGP